MADVLLDLELPGQTSAIARARHRLAELVGQTCRDAVDDASLIASELLANAIEHAEGPIRLRATRSTGIVRVEVHDESPVEPVVRHVTDDADSGRGLMIVAHLAVRWGVDAADRGKVVWAELSC